MAHMAQVTQIAKIAQITQKALFTLQSICKNQDWARRPPSAAPNQGL